MSAQYNQSYMAGPQPQGLSGVIIKMGLASTAKGANNVLIGIIIICLAIMVYFIRNTYFPTVEVTYYEDLSPDVRASLPQDILNKFPKRSTN